MYGTYITIYIMVYITIYNVAKPIINHPINQKLGDYNLHVVPFRGCCTSPSPPCRDFGPIPFQ